VNEGEPGHTKWNEREQLARDEQTCGNENKAEQIREQIGANKRAKVEQTKEQKSSEQKSKRRANKRAKVEQTKEQKWSKQGGRTRHQPKLRRAHHHWFMRPTP
jgi:hypothetical protein